MKTLKLLALMLVVCVIDITIIISCFPESKLYSSFGLYMYFSGVATVFIFLWSIANIKDKA